MDQEATQILRDIWNEMKTLNQRITTLGGELRGDLQGVKAELVIHRGILRNLVTADRAADEIERRFDERLSSVERRVDDLERSRG